MPWKMLLRLCVPHVWAVVAMWTSSDKHVCQSRKKSQGMPSIPIKLMCSQA